MDNEISSNNVWYGEAYNQGSAGGMKTLYLLCASVIQVGFLEEMTFKLQ